MKLKRTITIEIDCVKITRTHGSKILFRCELCQAKTEFPSQTATTDLPKLEECGRGEFYCEDHDCVTKSFPPI